MELNRNSTLTNVADALAGTWNRTVADNTVILEHGDMTIIRMAIYEVGVKLLPVIPSANTPYMLYGKDNVRGGIILANQAAIKCPTTGILEYTLLNVRKRGI